MKKLRHLLLTTVFLLAALIIVPEPFQINAQAATITAKTNYKKAPKMRKKGTYNVNAKKNSSYVRFVAPSSGTWTFTISNIRSWGGSPETTRGLGNWYVYTLRKPVNGSPYLTPLKVKTNGGKSLCLWTTSNAAYAARTNAGKKTVDKYLPSRKCVVKLKKGQSIYFKYFFTGVASQYKITVKK